MRLDVRELSPWAPEYGAACLSLAFMAALVALLGVYNNQSLAAWLLPSAISPNAVIAALNTLSRLCTSFVLSSAIGQWKWISTSRKQRSLKSFVYIDESSKGSFGGLKIVWNTRGRYEYDANELILKLISMKDMGLRWSHSYDTESCERPVHTANCFFTTSYRAPKRSQRYSKPSIRLCPRTVVP